MPNKLPYPLLFLTVLAVYFVLATAYAVVTPTWQSPDEPAHYNYIRHLADTGTLPVLEAGDYPAELLEEQKRRKWPPDLPIDSLRYESHQPPLFYALVTPVLLTARGVGLDLRGQVVALRLVSVILGAVLIYVTYQVGLSVYPELPHVALAAAGFVAFLPMHLAITGAINNDTLAELLLALLLLLCLRRLSGYVSQRRFYLLGGGLVGLALLTKTTIYLPALALPAVTEVLAWRRRGGFGFAPAVNVLITLYTIGFVLSAWWFTRNTIAYSAGDLFGWTRHDAIVVGQLTTAQWLAQLGPARALSQAAATLFKSFWGFFGWMAAPFQAEVYAALYLVTGLAVVGLALRGWRTRSWPRLEVWLLLVVVALAVTALVSYNTKFVQHQARYLFPALTPIALLFCLGLREVWAREHERLLLALGDTALAGLALLGLQVIRRNL